MMKFLKSQKGQGLVEYAILIGLIAVLSIAAVTTIGTRTRTAFQKVVNTFNP